MFVGRMEPNEEVLQRILHRCFLPSLAPFGQAEDFLTLANQKQELPLAAIYVGGMRRNEEIYRGSYIDAFCQVWFHLAQLFQRSRLKYEKVNGRTTDAKTSYDPLKQCTRLAGASDKVYQLLVHGQWFSLASSTTKTGRHDIAEILLKVALKLQESTTKSFEEHDLNLRIL